MTTNYLFKDEKKFGKSKYQLIQLFYNNKISDYNLDFSFHTN
jgi:hypothetical protein